MSITIVSIEYKAIFQQISLELQHKQIRQFSISEYFL